MGLGIISVTAPSTEHKHLTKMQKVLAGALSIEDRSENGAVIVVNLEGHKTKVEYHYDPRPLVETFKEVIPNVSEKDAIWLAAVNLTCLSSYSRVAYALKNILAPDSVAQTDVQSFVSAIEGLQAKMKYSLGTNLQVLHDRYGSDYTESYQHFDGSGRPTESFLQHLRKQIDVRETDIERQESTFQHYAVRVEAVLKHLPYDKNPEQLVVYDLFEKAKNLVMQTGVANAGVVFLEANLIEMGLLLQKGHRKSLADRLINAQNLPRINTNYAGALVLVPPADLKFYASLPLDRKMIRTRNIPKHFNQLRDQLKEVEEACQVDFDAIKKVFETLTSVKDRQLFIKHITDSSKNFVIYQRSGLPVPEVQQFIEANKEKKLFYLERRKDIFSVKSAQESSRNASIVDVVGLILQRTSPKFSRKHASPEHSLVALIPQIKNEKYFVRFINLFVNQTAQVEKCFDELFSKFRAKDTEGVDEILKGLEEA